MLHKLLIGMLFLLAAWLLLIPALLGLYGLMSVQSKLASLLGQGGANMVLLAGVLLDAALYFMLMTALARPLMQKAFGVAISPNYSLMIGLLAITLFLAFAGYLFVGAPR